MPPEIQPSFIFLTAAITSRRNAQEVWLPGLPLCVCECVRACVSACVYLAPVYVCGCKRADIVEGRNCVCVSTRRLLLYDCMCVSGNIELSMLRKEGEICVCFCTLCVQLYVCVCDR